MTELRNVKHHVVGPRDMWSSQAYNQATEFGTVLLKLEYVYQPLDFVKVPSPHLRESDVISMGYPSSIKNSPRRFSLTGLVAPLTLNPYVNG